MQKRFFFIMQVSRIVVKCGLARQGFDPGKQFLVTLAGRDLLRNDSAKVLADPEILAMKMSIEPRSKVRKLGENQQTRYFDAGAGN